MGCKLIVGAEIERPHAVQRRASPEQGRPREGGHDKSEEQEAANSFESPWQLVSSRHLLPVAAGRIIHYKSLARVPEELSTCFKERISASRKDGPETLPLASEKAIVPWHDDEEWSIDECQCQDRGARANKAKDMDRDSARLERLALLKKGVLRGRRKAYPVIASGHLMLFREVAGHHYPLVGLRRQSGTGVLLASRSGVAFRKFA
jgi:hypothetical protein